MFLVTITLSVLLFLYWLGTRKYRYWKVRGVVHDEPLPFVGNNLKQFVQQSSMAMMAAEMYEKYPEEKIVGFYRGTNPELVIRDPDIIKRILITDFQHFYARGILPHKLAMEPLLKNLFFADGDLWKLIRHRFTPAFSTAKLKAMFTMITERAEKLQLITEEVTRKDYYDARELMARYTTDLIGACAFGINMDTLNDENSQFRKLGKRIFYRNLRDAAAGALKILFPELTKNITLLAPEIERDMTGLVRSIAKQRGYKPSGKNDFIDLMLELKQKGIIVGESIEKKNPDGTPQIVDLDVDDVIMTAQAFVFFGAGFETSSTSSSYTLHQLAFHPEYQKKVQEEVDTVLARHDNKISYDAIREMHYLEKVFYEAMRMYPSVAYLYRQCTSNNYTIPEVGVTIDKSVKVMIPVKAIYKDEKYFKDPERFDPERFGPERKENSNFVYLPFGEGPRACVGARLGLMQSMAGIAAILQKYTVEPAICSRRHPIPDPCGIVSEGFKGGLPLKFIKRVT